MDVIEFLLLACSILQSPPQDKAPQPALFDELIRKTNEIEAFTASYRLSSTKSDTQLSINIAFRSPSDMRVELSGVSLMIIKGNEIAARFTQPDGGSTFAHVDLDELMGDRWRKLGAAVHLEFGKSAEDWNSDSTSCGAQLQFLVQPAGEGTKEEVTFSGTQACPRTALLGWLEVFRDQKYKTVEEADRVLIRTDRGTEISLSKQTGFIESVKKQDAEGTTTFVLEQLDLHPKLESNAFDAPAAPAGAVDGSSDFAIKFQRLVTSNARRKLASWISDTVKTGKLEWGPDARAHARKAYELLHSDSFAAEMAPWITKTKEWIERTAVWAKDAYARLDEGNDEGRAAIEDRLDERRKKMLESIEKSRSVRIERLEIEPSQVPDASLRAGLLELEQSAVESAFEHSVRDPLVEAFDSAIERAKSGG